MKNYLYLFSVLLLLVAKVDAQVNVNVSLPIWGPAVTTEEYYYLPDVESYYDIRQSKFIYLNNGVWIRSSNLPRRYRNYNLNAGHVVVINDYHGHRPYAHFKKHKVKYYHNDKHWKGNGKQKENHGNEKKKHKKK